MTEQQKPRILVIDDDPSLQELVAQLLEHTGFKITSALTAREGAAELHKQPLPDCVLLDLMLPDVSGLELLRQIRSKQMFEHLPIIILSTLADPETIREGLARGADRYITKPYLANNLTKMLIETLKTGRKHANT